MLSYCRDSASTPHKPYVLPITDSHGHIFVTDSMDLTSVNLMQLALKAAAVLCVMADIRPFKVIQGRQFWY